MKENRKILPGSKSCFVCGEENQAGYHLRSEWAGDKVVIRHTAQERDSGFRGMMHGGLLVTLLDEVMAWAVIISTEKLFFAVEVNARFHKPVPIGSEIVIEGWVTRKSPRLCLTEGRVWLGENIEAANATAKFMKMPETLSRDAAQDLVLRQDDWDPRSKQ